jgi:superfamily II DNA or RNA helicase
MKFFHLYDYQQDMKGRIKEAFWSHQSVMIQMPTGTGKTYLLAAVVSEYIAQNQGRIWIVVHLRELVCQISDTIKLHIPDYTHPLIRV